MKVRDLKKIMVERQKIRLTQMGYTLYEGECGECGDYEDMTVDKIEPDHRDHKRIRAEVYRRRR